MAKKLGTVNDETARKEADQAIQQNVTQATFLDAVREIVDWNEKAKTVNEGRKACRKKWKSEGIELGHLDAAIRMAEWEREAQRNHFDVSQKYAKWLGLAVGTQGNLFDGKADDELQQMEWDAIGFTAALTGKTATVPEECPPVFGQFFLKGWHRGANADFESAAPDAAKKSGPLTAEEKKQVIAESKTAAAKKQAVKAANKKALAPKSVPETKPKTKPKARGTKPDKVITDGVPDGETVQ